MRTLSLEEAAEILQKSTATLRRYRNENLNGFKDCTFQSKPGGKILILEDKLKEWMGSECQK